MSKHTPTEVPCHACRGSGRVPLDERSQTTYELIAKGRKKWTALAVQQALAEELTVNAMNNRLEKLRAAGLLTRERKGRSWLYYKMTA